jgi:hypothetical protein
MAQEPERQPLHEDPRNWRAWAILLGLLVMFAIGVFIYPDLVDRSPTRNRDSGASSSGTAPIGTAGLDAGAVIRELDTITGSNDGHELIGRKVDLHVTIEQHINDVAFWIGNADNRILVVLGRDNRDGADRQRGRPSSTSLQATGGSPVAVSGTIQGLPRPEAMYSWGLTNADRDELHQRRIYIRADATEH